jgi:hypothetical protein
MANGTNTARVITSSETGLLKTNAVGRHLKRILKQRNAPAHRCRDVPRRGSQVFQVAVPGKSHENIATDQQQDGLQGQGDGLERVHGLNYPAAGIERAAQKSAPATNVAGALY